MTEKFIQSNINQSKEQAAKEYALKIMDLQKIAYDKGYKAGYKKGQLDINRHRK